MLVDQGNKGLECTQHQIVVGDINTDEEPFVWEARQALENYFTHYQKYIFVDVEVDQLTKLLVAVITVRKYHFLNLLKILDDEVSTRLHLRSLSAFDQLIILISIFICCNAKAKTNISSLKHKRVIKPITDG